MKNTFQTLIIELYDIIYQSYRPKNPDGTSVRKPGMTHECFFETFIENAYIGKPTVQFITNCLNGKKQFGKASFYQNLADPVQQAEYYDFFMNNLKKTIPYIELSAAQIYNRLLNKCSDEDKIKIQSKYPFTEENAVECITKLFFWYLNNTDNTSTTDLTIKNQPINHRHCYYRNTEKNKIDKMMQNKGYAIISGEPGVGKTELAYHYAKVNKSKYQLIKFAKYNQSIYHTLGNIVEWKNYDTTNLSDYNKFKVASHKLIDLKHKALLVIYGVDNDDIITDLLDKLKQINCDFIITTRLYHSEALEIKNLSLKELRNLVKKKTNDSTAWSVVEPHIDNLIEISENNTLLTLLLAKALIKLNIDKDKSNITLYDIASSNCTILHNSQKKTLQEHILDLLGFQDMSDTQRNIMCFIGLLNEKILDKVFLKKCCPLCDDQEIGRLVTLNKLRVHTENSIEKYECAYIKYLNFIANRNCNSDIFYLSEINAINRLIEQNLYDKDMSNPLYNLATSLIGNHPDWITCRNNILTYLKRSKHTTLYTNLSNHISNLGFINELDVKSRYYELLMNIDKSQDYYDFIGDKSNFIVKLQKDAELISEYIGALNIYATIYTNYNYIFLNKATAIIMCYLTNKITQSHPASNLSIEIGDIIELLNIEINASSFKETRMYKSIKSFCPSITINEIPEQFTNIQSYKELCIILLGLTWMYVFNNMEQSPNAAENITKMLDKFSDHILRNNALLDNNRLYLGCQKARILTALHRYNEANELLDELDNTIPELNNNSYFRVYLNQSIMVKTALFLKNQIEEFQTKSVKITLADMYAMQHKTDEYVDSILSSVVKKYNIEDARNDQQWGCHLSIVYATLFSIYKNQLLSEINYDNFMQHINANLIALHSK